MNDCFRKALQKHLFYVMPVILMLLITSVFSNVVAADNLVNEVMQQRMVNGNVTDSQGEPLIGVTVAIKGMSTGTVTDFDGNYTLANVPENATLVFSYVGFTTLEEVVGGRTTINIVLMEEATLMDELVVVGYNTIRRSQLTSSVVLRE